MGRYVLEGEWSGYRSSQRRIVHREVISEKRAKDFKLSSIEYSDGTRLDIYVRPAKPRERVSAINGYSSLIRKAEKTGKEFVTVSELNQ